MDVDPGLFAVECMVQTTDTEGRMDGRMDEWTIEDYILGTDNWQYRQAATMDTGVSAS